jgi:O-antigen/teichoic acid export membrane protein
LSAVSAPHPSRASFSGSRVAKALASTALGQVLSIGQNFLLVPLYLRAWGEQGYGKWTALTALVSYLSLLDLGGQSFVGNRLAEAFALNKPDEFRRTLDRGFTLFSLIAGTAAALIGLLLLLPGLPWDREARLVLASSAASFSLSVCGGVIIPCYAATGQVVRATAVGMLGRLATVIASVVALYASCTMPAYALLLLVVTAIANVFIVRDLRHAVGDLFRLNFEWRLLRGSMEMLRGSLDFWFFSLAGALNLQGLVLVVSSVAGASAVAQFVTHRAAASLIVYSGNLLRPALWTEMTFMAARGDTTRLRETVSLATRLSACSAAIAAMGICVVAPSGYALWTRSQLKLDIPLLVVLVVQAALAAAWSAASWPLMAANKPRILARWSVVNGALTVAGAYIAMRLGYGLRGVAAVSLGADIVCGLLPIPLASAAFLAAPFGEFWRDLGRALACALPFGAAAYLSIRCWDHDGMRIASFAVASLVLAWPVLLGLLGARDLARIRKAVFKR